MNFWCWVDTFSWESSFVVFFASNSISASQCSFIFIFSPRHLMASYFRGRSRCCMLDKITHLDLQRYSKQAFLPVCVMDHLWLVAGNLCEILQWLFQLVRGREVASVTSPLVAGSSCMKASFDTGSAVVRRAPAWTRKIHMYVILFNVKYVRSNS